MATITYKPSLEDIPPFLKRICHLSSEALYQVLSLSISLFVSYFLVFLSCYKIIQYLLETSVYPREHECMKELRDATDKQPLCVQSFTRIFVLLY